MIKLNSLEIESFRAYRERQTFDFTCRSGDPAQLVVIYAPNGFGKTSFFDAIEWGLTGKISRIENNTIIKNTAKFERGHILKNLDSKDLSGRVKFTDHTGKIFELQTKPLIGRRTTDYDEGEIICSDSTLLSNIYKKGVEKTNILSHDKIDAFLLFNNPQERYRTLAHFWDYSNDTDYFKVVSSLSNEAESQIQLLNEEIEKLNNEMKKLITPKVELESYINKLNKLDCINVKINMFENATTTEKIDDYLKICLEHKVRISSQHSAYKEMLDSLGSIQEIFPEYIAKKQAQELENIQLKLLADTLEDFKELPKHESTLKEYQISIRGLDEERNIVNSLINKETEYLAALNSINSIKETKESIQGQIIELSKNREQRKTVLIQLNTDLDMVAKKLQELHAFQINANDNINKVLHNQSMQRKIEKKILKCEKVNKARVVVFENIQTKLDQYKHWMTLDAKQLLVNPITKEICPQYLQEIREIQQAYELPNSEIKYLQKQYIEYGQMNEELNKIVKSGKQMVEKSRISKCPLCSQEYNGFQELLARIDSAIPDVLGLDTIVNELENKKLLIKSLDEKMESTVAKIQVCIMDQITVLELEIIGIIKKISRASTKFKTYIEEKNSCATNIQQLSSFFNQLNINIYTADGSVIEKAGDYLHELIEQSIKQTADINSKLDETNKSLATVTKEIERLESALAINDLLLNELLQNPSYIDVSTALTKYKQPYSNIIFHDKYKEIMTQMSEMVKKQEEIKARILNIQSRIEGSNYEKLDLQYREKRTLKVSHDLWIGDFNSKVQKVKLKSDTLTNEIIEQELNNLKEYILKTETAIWIIDNIITQVEYIRKNIERTQKEKEQITKKAEMKFTLGIQGRINSYKEEAKKIILDKINRAFNLDAINSIYSRIEPHPDLKVIEFKPSFTEDRPELEIYGVDGKERQNPVLYFSSAQVDILSLSIFLAQALQPKCSPINTVFMDDPINHMDSINVLSVIDLLRSLTKDLDRQIILSTHNENLFKLIQQKLPSRYYPSKFIELATYGIVKNQ